MPRSPKRGARSAAPPVPELIFVEKCESALKKIPPITVYTVGVGLIFLLIALENCPSPRAEPASYVGASLMWSIGKWSVPKRCDVVTVDIDPETPSHMRVEKDGPDCVNASVMFRMPLGWEVTDETYGVIPGTGATRPRTDDVPHPGSADNRQYFLIPGMGVPYTAFWSTHSFQIVFDQELETST